MKKRMAWMSALLLAAGSGSGAWAGEPASPGGVPSPAAVAIVPAPPVSAAHAASSALPDPVIPAPIKPAPLLVPDGHAGLGVPAVPASPAPPVPPLAAGVLPLPQITPLPDPVMTPAPECGLTWAWYSPNMFGGGFGGPRYRFIGERLTPGSLNGTSVVLGLAGATRATTPPPAGAQTYTWKSPPGGGFAPVLTAPGVGTAGVPLAAPLTVTQKLNSAVVPQNFLPNAATLAQIQSLANPGFGIYTAVQTLEHVNVPDGTLRQLSFGTITGQAVADTPWALNYFLPVNDILSVPVAVDLPSPSMQGVIARVKVADDNNPLPRDRFIFNYDYYNNVPLTTGGVDVNRFVLGFEKTFCRGWMSVDLRVPFGSTLDQVVYVDGVDSLHTELGNLHVGLKGLLLRSETLNVSTGLGCDVPTGPDVEVWQADGTKLLRVENDAVILTPYLAALYTPNPSLFMQGWCSTSFGTNGNKVYGDPTFTGALVYHGGLFKLGTLEDQVQMQLDGQLGYWVIRPGQGSSVLQGLAPFTELHYGTTITDAKVVQSAGWQVGNLSDHYNELNLSAGIVTLLGDNVYLSTGIAVPLLNEANRSMDFQVGVRANVFFGPRSGYRTRGALVNTY